MGVNGCTGRKREGGVNSKVVGAYGSDVLDTSGQPLLAFSEKKHVPLPTRSSAHPSRESHILAKFQIAGQRDQMLVRNVILSRHTASKPESDHNLVAADIRLLRRFAANHLKREVREGGQSTPNN